MPTRPGYLTTEFWLMVGSCAVNAVIAVGLFAPGSTAGKVVAAINLTLCSLGYTFSRATLKAAGFSGQGTGDSGPSPQPSPGVPGEGERAPNATGAGQGPRPTVAPVSLSPCLLVPLSFLLFLAGCSMGGTWTQTWPDGSKTILTQAPTLATDRAFKDLVMIRTPKGGVVVFVSGYSSTTQGYQLAGDLLAAAVKLAPLIF